MADSTIVTKISGDASGLVAALEKGKQAAVSFGDGMGKIADGIGRKFEFRDISRTLATALGISLTSIADKVARFFIGFSKDSEEALERLVKVTEKAADEAEKALERARERAAKKEEEHARLIMEQAKLVWEARMQYFENEKKEREERARDEKKKLEETFREDLKWAQERSRLNDRLKEQHLAALKPEEREAALNKEILDLRAQQLTLDKDSNEYKALQIKINEANLAIEQKITHEKERQRAEAEKAARLALAAEGAKVKGIAGGLTVDELRKLDEYIKSEGKRGSLPTRTGGQLATSSAFADESDKTLSEIVRRGKKELESLSSAFGVFGIGADIRKMQIQSTVSAAQLEMRNRQRLEMDFRVGGESLARQNFRGDPQAFERFFAQIIKGQSVQEKTLQTQEDILKLLKGGIPTLTVDSIRGG